MSNGKTRRATSRRTLTKSFTAVFHKTKNWWVANVEELPGANTQGKTKAEAKRNLQDAVRMIIEANRELSEKELRGTRVLKEEFTVQL